MFRTEMIPWRARAAVVHRMTHAVRAAPHSWTASFGDAGQALVGLERRNRHPGIGRRREAKSENTGENNSHCHACSSYSVKALAERAVRRLGAADAIIEIRERNMRRIRPVVRREIAALTLGAAVLQIKDCPDNSGFRG